MSRLRCATWIFAAHALVALALLSPAWIRPDSVATYAYLDSMVNDGDLSFFDEWAAAGMVRDGVTYFSEVTPAGALANHWWIGTSMLAAPFYVIGMQFAAAGPLLAWASVIFSAAALSIACSFMREHRALAIIAASLGTPLFWYTFRFPLGTHAAGALCVALIFAALFRTDSGALAGLCAALAIVTRLQHFVLVPAIIIVALLQRRPRRWWLAATGAGALPLLGQGIAWFAIYGTPLGPVTRGANLQGVTWMPFQNITLGQVLFSSYHGLIAWSPVVVVAIIGWFAAMRRDRDVAVACILMFAGEWIANGTLDRYFWGGMSFGGRRFVDLAVPFALGIAWFAERIRTWLAVVIITPLVTWSVALMIAAHGHAISLARYVSGGDLMHAVFNAQTYAKAVSTPLHTVIDWRAMVVALFVAIACVPLRRFASLIGPAYAAIFAVAVFICATRTPRAAAEGRAHIDVRRSARAGPLIDQRGLLTDEIDWARARGDDARVRRTSAEVAAIDRALAQLSR